MCQLMVDQWGLMTRIKQPYPGTCYAEYPYTQKTVVPESGGGKNDGCRQNADDRLQTSRQGNLSQVYHFCHSTAYQVGILFPPARSH